MLNNNEIEFLLDDEGAEDLTHEDETLSPNGAEDEDDKQEIQEDDVSFSELIGESESTKTISPEEVESEVLSEVLKSSFFRNTKTTIEELKEKLNAPLSDIFPDSNGLLELLVNLEFRIKLKRFFDFDEIKGFQTLAEVISAVKDLV